jgi:predicted DNA-binding transcriptional regulator AlpA
MTAVPRPRFTSPPPAAAPREQLLHEREAAAMLGVSPTTLSTWRSRQRYDLPFVRLGGARSIRYRLSDLQAFIAAGLVENDPEAAP